VGLLVQRGTHAVVMTGFKATANPAKGPSYELIGIYYSDPLGPRNQYVSVADSPLTRYTQLDATSQYDQAWYNRYIIVAPQN
jgi:hypothetical protein